MIIKRVYDVSLNITDPINYCTNKKEHTLIELNNHYKNKCFMGSFILDILDILQISSCRIVNTNSSADGIIDVKFLAKIYTLNAWDILVGVKIEKNQTLIGGKYQKNELVINVSFPPTHLQGTVLHVGQLIPTRVCIPIHNPKENSISAAAVLLTCDLKNTIYKVRGKIDKSHMEEILSIIDNIDQELDKRSLLLQTKKKSIIFFESLLYPYKSYPDATTITINKNKEWFGPSTNLEKSSNYINLHSMLNMDLTGYWTRPLTLCRSCPFAMTYSDKPTEEYVTTYPHLLMIDFLKNTLNYLVAIREMSELYTDDLIKSHENIWNLMKRMQQ
jgi:hypothetical protein